MKVKRKVNITEVILLIFILMFGLFYSCAKDNYAYRNKESEQKIRSILTTPDSLRSPKDEIFFQKLKKIYYEGCTVVNDRIEVTITKKELKARGIPEAYYDILKKDMENLNNKLDMMNSHKQMVLDHFRNTKEEYKTPADLYPSK